MPTENTMHSFAGRDGASLTYREVGEGRPLVLIHGLFSTATVNWVRYDHAGVLAARGHRVIMPDLRAHGDSARSHAAADYPPDVLADDGLALIEQLGLVDYDLGGYSLGGRTVVRMVVRGARPRRAIVAGMGLDGILQPGSRSAFFRNLLAHPGSFARGSPEALAEAFLKTVGGDAQALVHVLDTFVATPVEALAILDMPTLVLAGIQDLDNGSAQALAAMLPDGRYVSMPGNHMSAVTRPELGLAIADFLG